jgi:hypothetical protein
MSVTQTVEVPASHRLVIDVPSEIPVGQVILTFTPVPRYGSDPEADELKRKPISEYFGILSPNSYGDGAVYQRNIRNEWDD